MKLQVFDSSCFCSKSQFEGDGLQNYLTFQLVKRYFKRIANRDHTSAWKSKGLSDENVKASPTSNNSLAPAINNINTKSQVKFDVNYLKLEKVTFTDKKVINIHIAYEINLRSSIQDVDCALGNILFGAVKLTKNTDPHKYKYPGYSIEFDAGGSFSFSDGSRNGKNVVIFGAEMSSSVHIDKKKKDILILGKNPTDGLHDTKLTEEDK